MGVVVVIIELQDKSYITLAEADGIVVSEYYSDNPHKKLWDSLDDGDKAKILIQGTRDLETLNYIGTRGNNKWLKWPRFIGGELMTPIEIKRAVIEQGLSGYIRELDDRVRLQELGVTQISIGPSSESYKSNGDIPVINRRVMATINRYILKSIKV
jgi:hypothetical protein